MNSFAKLVTGQMKAKRVSLRRVAREVNLDPSFFSKVLTGKRTPPADETTLKRIAQFLEIDPLLLIISTGTIPSEIQHILESSEFLNRFRHQISAPEAGPAVQLAPSPKAAPRREKPPVQEVPMIRRSQELSEDLL